MDVNGTHKNTNLQPLILKILVFACFLNHHHFTICRCNNQALVKRVNPAGVTEKLKNGDNQENRQKIGETHCQCITREEKSGNKDHNCTENNNNQ